MATNPTRPKVSGDTLAVVGVAVLGIIAFSALWMGYDLIRMLITGKIETDKLGVFVGLVASITAFGSGALGFIGGALFGSRRAPNIGPVQGDVNIPPDTGEKEQP